jgi:hypothetical protein
LSSISVDGGPERDHERVGEEVSDRRRGGSARLACDPLSDPRVATDRVRGPDRTRHRRLALAGLAESIAPELMSELYAVANRLLPGPGGIGSESRLGRQSESSLTRSFPTLLTRHAAARNDESANGGGYAGP